MSEETKTCPFCGEETNINSEKCNVCGESLLKTCPFCGEKVNIKAIKCKHCGENQNKTPYKQKINKTVIITILISIIIVITLCSILFAKFANNGLTDIGYKSININYSHKNDGFSIFNKLVEEENDLLEFFSKKNNKEDNTKLFEIYMDNLLALREDFFNIFDYSKDLNKDYGIKLNKNLSDASGPVRIIYPKVNVFYFDYMGAFGIPFDNDYIINTYCPYIDNEWKEYFILSKDEYKDFAKAEYYDDSEMKYNAYSKWATKWNEFIRKYPNFYFNDKIKITIYNYRKQIGG